DAVDRIAADRLFDIHTREIARQHGGRTQVRFAVGKHREFDRKAARLENAALDVFSDLLEVCIARRKLGPGIADADDRLALEFVIRYALVLHPAAIHEAVLVLRSEPLRGT